MIYKNLLKYFFAVILFSTNLIFSTTYYIDSRNGNDNNTGLSESSPWKTVSKVNSKSYLPGDQILFKRGEIWTGTALVIKNSGTSSSRIVFGAYGYGDKPVISLRASVPGWNIASNWTAVSGDTIWRRSLNITLSKKIQRMWLSNIEYAAAHNYYLRGNLTSASESQGTVYQGDNLDNLGGGATTYGVNRVHRFLIQTNGNIYVYTPGGGNNPAIYYSNIEIPTTINLSTGGITYQTLGMQNADYVTIENIDIQGGYNSITIEGSNYVIIDNCSFGKYAQDKGIQAGVTGFLSGNSATTNGEIKNCIIDSDYNVKYYWHFGDENLLSFGVAIVEGATNWNVHHNEVANWANNLFAMQRDGYSFANTEFYNNEVYAPNMTYSKGGQVNGDDNNKATHVKYYNNYFHDITSGLNLCSHDVYVSYNIFENIRYSTNDHATSSNSGYGFQIVDGATGVGSPDNLYIYNNTFKNLYGLAGLLFSNDDVWWENNLMVNLRMQYPKGNKIYLQYPIYMDGRINNNLFFSEGSTTAEVFARNSTTSTNYTVTQLNTLTNDATHETNNNLQHTSTLSSLINTSGYYLPSGSPAINTGINRSWMRSTDYYGNAISGTRDIGAVEFTSNQNSAPVITSSPVLTASVGELYSYDVNASGSPTPTYKLNTFPSGMTINSTSGLIQWTPSAVGSFNVTVEANNGVSPAAIQSFAITVTSTNIAPAINSTPVTAGQVNQAYSYDVNASGNPTPTYKLSTFPSGMTINSTSGLIQWTPASTGSYDVSVEASNGVIPAAIQSFTITVTSTDVAPAINSTPVTAGEVNQAYSYDVNASGNPAPTYKLTTFPSGMTINSTSGLIQWTPASTGNYDVTVEASNGINPAASQTFVVTISENSTSIPTSVISYWKLDEKSGSTFTDEIGKNNAAAISIPTPVTGLVSGAQKFNGSTAKLDVAANSSIDFGAKDNFSVEFWYKGTTAPSTVKCAVGRYISSTGARWWIGLNASDGKARFYMSSGGSSAAVNGSVITDGSWHHVAATRNGSTGSIKIYVDGALQASTTKSFTADFSSAAHNLNIGWLSFQDAYTLDGNLDEVALHNIELTAAEIQKHYTNGLSGKSYFGDPIPAFLTVNTKIYLQGPFSNGIMNTTLRDKALLPLGQPYNIAPWNYSGTEKVTSIPVGIVDWILVEIRNDAASTSVVKQHAAFLKNDGSIVDLDGTSQLKFDNITDGDYYIIIKHRNHLAVMSAAKIALGSNSTLYDFSTSSSKAYGTNSLVNLGNNIYGMITGDGDANGVINVLDYGTVAKSTQSTYSQGDYDLNNSVDDADYEKTGTSLFQSSKVPQ